MSKAAIPGRPSSIRIGDDERDRAVDALQRHHSAGRLSFAEFQERMSEALEARTWGELERLFVDLPAVDRTPTRPSAGGGGRQARGAKQILGGVLVGAVLVVAGGIATDSRGPALPASSQTISYRWAPSMRVQAARHDAIPYRWAWTFQYSAARTQRKGSAAADGDGGGGED